MSNLTLFVLPFAAATAFAVVVIGLIRLAVPEQHFGLQQGDARTEAQDLERGPMPVSPGKGVALHIPLTAFSLKGVLADIKSTGRIVEDDPKASREAEEKKAMNKNG